jgi:hypothetical protein
MAKLILHCDETRTRSGTATDTGWDPDDKGVARSRARVLLVFKIKHDAWNFAKGFQCVEEGCFIKRVVITIGEIKLEVPVQRPFGGGGAPGPKQWACDASCDWSVTVSCPRHTRIPKKDTMMEEQELDCRHGEEAFACMASHATGSDSQQARANPAAMEAIKKQVAEDIDRAIQKVTCDPECPHKTITVEFGPIKDVTDATLPQPDASGDFFVQLDQRWTIRIKCS